MLPMRLSQNNKDVTLVKWPAVTSHCPGLAVCRVPERNHDNSGAKPSKFFWEIVHIPSGYMVPGCADFTTRRAALAVARELSVLADWTVQKEGIVSQMKLKHTALWEIKDMWGK